MMLGEDAIAPVARIAMGKRRVRLVRGLGRSQCYVDLYVGYIC